MTFMAATYYTEGPNPQPSAFSNTLFDGFFNWANATTSREPVSDWTETTSPQAVGFSNRPVFGAMWAPALVANAASLGLGRAGRPDDAALAHANAVFERVWAERRATA